MAAINPASVAGFSAFAGLDPAQLAELLRDARSTHHAKGSHVFEQGADAQSVFVLLHGHVRAVKVTPAGEQIVVRYIVPGELFGLAMAIGRDSYPATAVAVDDSVVLSWPSAAWKRMAASAPALATNALQTVGDRLQDAHAQVMEISTAHVEPRIARALLRLAKQAGRKVEGGIALDFPVSRQDIAQMTSTTLHTVSRIMSGWQQRGLVESSRRGIVIRDPHRLFALGEGPG